MLLKGKKIIRLDIIKKDLIILFVFLFLQVMCELLFYADKGFYFYAAKRRKCFDLTK